MKKPSSYWAAIVHRVSGIALALFLPLHFWALCQALQGEAALDSFLRWSEQPLVKFAETALVLLLAAHLAGGLRLLALEFLAWRDGQKGLLAAASWQLRPPATHRVATVRSMNQAASLNRWEIPPRQLAMPQRLQVTAISAQQLSHQPRFAGASHF